jgi:hypothetical protein
MKQLALDIGWRRCPRWTTFLSEGNTAALDHLRLWAGNPCARRCPAYLWGEGGCGKTHLLQAVRGRCASRARPWAGWTPPCSGTPAFDERWEVGALDDCHLYTAEQQAMAFNWFVNAQSPERGPPAGCWHRADRPPADLAARRPAHPPGLGPCVPIACPGRSRAPRRAAPRRRRAGRVPERRGHGLHAQPLLARPQQPHGCSTSSTPMPCAPSAPSPSRSSKPCWKVNESPAMKLALFDLDHTLLPLDSDYAWGEFTTRIGWTDRSPLPAQRRLFCPVPRRARSTCTPTCALPPRGAPSTAVPRRTGAPALHGRGDPAPHAPAALELVRQHRPRATRWSSSPPPTNSSPAPLPRPSAWTS